MVLIDEELCIGCGDCAADCPSKSICMTAGKAAYTAPCMECGHCVAVCPVQAVSISGYDMQDVEEYDPGTFCINPENMLHAIKFRRSIRNFKPDKIEEEKVRNILQAGRYTATAKNGQATTFVFVQDNMEEFRNLVWEILPKLIDIFKKSTPIYAKIFRHFYERRRENPCEDNLLYNTPAFLVIATDNHSMDGGLAAANMENMAVSEGLGVLFSGYMMRVISESPALRNWLEVGEKPIAGCMLIGYPAVTYRRTAPRLEGNIIRK